MLGSGLSGCVCCKGGGLFDGELRGGKDGREGDQGGTDDGGRGAYKHTHVEMNALRRELASLFLF